MSVPVEAPIPVSRPSPGRRGHLKKGGWEPPSSLAFTNQPRAGRYWSRPHQVNRADSAAAIISLGYGYPLSLIHDFYGCTARLRKRPQRNHAVQLNHQESNHSFLAAVTSFRSRTSLSMSIGLDMPASIEASTSSAKALAVMAIMGMVFASRRSSLRMARVAS